jgi:hypothetical protein
MAILDGPKIQQTHSGVYVFVQKHLQSQHQFVQPNVLHWTDQVWQVLASQAQFRKI